MSETVIPYSWATNVTVLGWRRMLGWPLPEKILVRAASEAVMPHSYRFIDDADLTTSFDILRRLCSLGEDRNRGYFAHYGAAKYLAKLLLPLEPYLDEIDIKEITAVSASKGWYLGNLDRLKESIYPHTSPLSMNEQVVKLYQDILSEGVARNSDGGVRVIKEGWSGRYILCNYGASRRFALLRSLVRLGEIKLSASIEEWRLNHDAVKALTRKYWIFAIPEASWRPFERVIYGWYGFSYERIGSTSSLACRDRLDQTRWAVVAVQKNDRSGRRLQSAFRSIACPLFDVSQWIEMLSLGRKAP